MDDDTQMMAGRTTSPELNRILPLVLLLLLWALCRRLSDGVVTTYASGFVDGAFTLLVALAAVRLARSYQVAGGKDLLEARKGLMIGIVCALGAMLVIVMAMSLA